MLTGGLIFYLFSLNFVTVNCFLKMMILITESVFVGGFSVFFFLILDFSTVVCRSFLM